MERRGRSFLCLISFFGLFVKFLFLYGPIVTIAILSFQGPQGGLTFPMNGVSLHWFYDLFEEQAVGDIWEVSDDPSPWVWSSWSQLSSFRCFRGTFFPSYCSIYSVNRATFRGESIFAALRFCFILQSLHW